MIGRRNKKRNVVVVEKHDVLLRNRNSGFTFDTVEHLEDKRHWDYNDPAILNREKDKWEVRLMVGL